MEHKKLAAVMAAITAVISSEEQEAAQSSHNAQETDFSFPAPFLNLWGLSGRQTIMNANFLVQQRLYK